MNTFFISRLKCFSTKGNINKGYDLYLCKANKGLLMCPLTEQALNSYDGCDVEYVGNIKDYIGCLIEWFADSALYQLSKLEE